MGWGGLGWVGWGMVLLNFDRSKVIRFENHKPKIFVRVSHQYKSMTCGRAA